MSQPTANVSDHLAPGPLNVCESIPIFKLLLICGFMAQLKDHQLCSLSCSIFSVEQLRTS